VTTVTVVDLIGRALVCDFSEPEAVDDGVERLARLGSWEEGGRAFVAAIAAWARVSRPVVAKDARRLC
jgi:hypothetical protein